MVVGAEQSLDCGKILNIELCDLVGVHIEVLKFDQTGESDVCQVIECCIERFQTLTSADVQ